MSDSLHLVHSHCFQHAKDYICSQISQSISQITKPLLGMFVLNWMHFSRRFQKQPWNLTILYFFKTFLWSFRTKMSSAPAHALYTSFNISQNIFTHGTISSLDRKNLISIVGPWTCMTQNLKWSYIQGFAIHMFKRQRYIWGSSCTATIYTGQTNRDDRISQPAPIPWQQEILMK